MICKNQQNLKVHFAGAEVLHHALSINAANVKYNLFSAYSFIRKAKLNNIAYTPIPKYIQELSEHSIMDSGLFTLMFGSESGDKSEAFLSEWTDKLIEFMRVSKYTGTYVEVDCQKVLGVKQSWKFREYMKGQTNNRQINVFHFEDGQKGLDRMIEYSNYIALSIPELRALKKKEYTYQLACYIKNKKPNIDIHLLGCTELDLLKKCNFCSSSDSTSWLAANKFGRMHLDKDRVVKDLHPTKIVNEYKNKLDKFSNYKGVNKLTEKGRFNYAVSILQLEYYKDLFSKHLGEQE